MTTRSPGKSLKAKPAPPRRPDAADENHGSFPIVAIGASAGGLEALGEFFSQVPLPCGMAFVVIQHLDPTQKGLLPELLQHLCKLSVMEASDGRKVKPDHVYVIPPNRDLSILHGTLHLLAPSAPRGLRLPIDFFFRALAEDRQQQSIGVILSGMGSDGTLGLRAIKDKGGLTLVQSADSAKFDGMPRTAIDAGLADIVAPATQLATQMLAAVRHSEVAARASDRPDQNALDKIVILLRTQTGHDFSLYKKSTLYRRIERRMAIHLIDGIAHYLSYLSDCPREVDVLFKELLIGVTRFFRDPDAWDSLKTAALPALLAEYPDGKELRAWVPGCATGEEAYTLAILLAEALEALDNRTRYSVQIYATDLDGSAIDIARQGIYPKNIAADVPAERLDRFFVAEESGYRIAPKIREMVIFATQNVISDPPFTRLDILTCRNVLIYFAPELQKKLLPLFHFSLNPGGILLLGSAETVGIFGDLFTPIDLNTRLYRRSFGVPLSTTIEFPSPHRNPLPAAKEAEAPMLLQAQADQVLLRRFSPPAVLTNRQGEILYINGRTGQYLELPSGRANWSILAMVREDLRFDLTNAFQKSLRQSGIVTVPRVQIDDAKGISHVGLSVEALEQPEALRGTVLVVFHEAAAPATGPGLGRPRGRTRKEEPETSREEARQLREELQTTREEMQTSQEELKSANEELQSTNEELQSANEELTTSKEEMQSLNEELQTVNAELQSKVEDLTRASNDMNNLLNSMEIATVFLDNQLHIRRFTTPATRLIKLIGGDVGRPLSDIATDLDYPDLSADAREVLRTLVFSEKTLPTINGRWFTVRIMPYRTTDNMIDGVVITCIDVTIAKNLEAELRKTDNRSAG